MGQVSEYQSLRDNLQKLRLTKIDEYLPGYLDSGAGKGKSLTTALLELTDAELKFRDGRAAEVNFKLSNFPGRKTFADFDFSYQPSIDREQMMDLRSLRFLGEAENVIFIGSPGVGKTHLATAIGIEATNSHVATYFIHFRSLVDRFRKAIAEGREEATLKNISKYKLLIVDEIGYFPVGADVSSMFFQLVAARYERRSMIVTSNKPLSKWGEIFSDPVIATAIIDRLVHHSTIVRIAGRSYRIKGKIDEEPGEPIGVKEVKEKEQNG